MVQKFNALEEARKHPGVTAGGLATIILTAAAVVYLSQRTGPTRYQQLKTRMNPRGWVNTEGFKDRLYDVVDTFRSRAEDFGERAGDFSRGALDRAEEFSEDARDRASDWFRGARARTRSSARRRGGKARRYADEAIDYARDHRREGGALLAVATVAALIGAAALESRRPDSRVRRMARF